MYAYTVVSLHCTKWLPLSFTFITIQCNKTDFTGTRHWHLEIQTNVLVVHWGCGRFTYESFRQRPVRYLLKSFLLRVGSVSQLLLPDKWKKERGIYMGQYRFFCIMTEKKEEAYTCAVLVSLVSGMTYVCERDFSEMTRRRNERSPFNDVFVVNVTSNWLINVEWADHQWKMQPKP